MTAAATGTSGRARSAVWNWVWTAVGVIVLIIIGASVYQWWSSPSSDSNPATTAITCGAGTVKQGDTCVLDPNATTQRRVTQKAPVVQYAPDGLPMMGKSRWHACLERLGLLKRCGPREVGGRQVIWCNDNQALAQASQCN